MPVKTLDLSEIKTTRNLQPRSSMNFIAIAEYAEAMKDERQFPPLEVVYDGSVYWLWDGFHRKAAAEQAELTEVDVNVTEGTLQDAEWMALGANQTHGLKRSNEDKRRAVELALAHPASSKLSSRQVASHCGVSKNLVISIREKLSVPKGQIEATRNGTTYAMNTTNIGRTKQSPTAKIAPDVIPSLFETPIPDNPEEITRLASATPETQAAIVARMAIGEAATVAEARKQIARENPPEPTETPPIPQGKYRCIVIDPPWPMKKIERNERPDQGIDLDYPTMSLDEIAALPVGDMGYEDGCHLYLWVTQKFLPDGLDLVKRWGFKYQCLMTWRKNVGITPYSWMYDTEHVIFAKRGSLQLERFGLRLSFDAQVKGHSVKPDVFFDERVLLASPEPRLEMFARKPRKGFEVWGNEV